MIVACATVGFASRMPRIASHKLSSLGTSKQTLMYGPPSSPSLTQESLDSVRRAATIAAESRPGERAGWIWTFSVFSFRVLLPLLESDAIFMVMRCPVAWGKSQKELTHFAGRDPPLW